MFSIDIIVNKRQEITTETIENIFNKYIEEIINAPTIDDYLPSMGALKSGQNMLDEVEITVYDNSIELVMTYEKPCNTESIYTFVNACISLVSFVGDKLALPSVANKPDIYIYPIYYKCTTMSFEPVITNILLVMDKGCIYTQEYKIPLNKKKSFSIEDHDGRQVIVFREVLE